ncbi:MAG: D-alanyl-D-alanine carboxypeptidase family protein [Methylococcaceae bacterium]|nr:D-alanyl-D-alanine carboxypeptidase family protein [Methylococcaceae bacterium]MDZ4156872.1 D-alanyl-D-alanine carboxypeptidase family protein [Methylococcales bacterium]MDP2394080.1 D-alanyl-D-alanine carboxypeptidase family protein [Methylococcaceae bacterium]MDP3018456.1 D-alanyl-D-alanine carboxypeptidase family protein [Methylococcaceae bacterium]MDP3392126.1 D-alanyl-D-alanine carboxypeptidase family protein [Methylococcaceae bacterium]
MTSPSRTFKFSIFLLFSLIFTSLQLHAEEADILTPTPPTVSAGSYILQDFRSGKVLAENNADVKLAPASLTKIMTVFVVFTEIRNGHLHLDDTATISRKAWATGGSKMFIKVDDKVKIEDLLKGVIIQSGNDASVALAEHVAGDESTFAEMMNQYAQRLGMLNTHFVDSNGLPAENHYTTARDLATLTSALIKEFPEYYRWFSQQEFTYNNITQHNRNTLLSRDGSVDGVKTGFTDDAGYCLVASALRDDMRLISVVMNTKSAAARAAENQNLLNYGFRFFEAHKIFQGKTALAEPRVWKGDEKNAPLGLAEALYVTIPRRQFDDVKSEIVVDPKIMAPIQEGAKLGSVKVTLKGEVLANKDLIALTAVQQGGIFRRAYDSVAMLLGKSDAK